MIAGKIYNIGGKTARAVVANNQIYDVATKTWSARSAHAEGALELRQTPVVNNILYVLAWRKHQRYIFGNSRLCLGVQPEDERVEHHENRHAHSEGGGGSRGGEQHRLRHWRCRTRAKSGSLRSRATILLLIPRSQPRHPASLLVGKSRFAGGLIKPTIVAAGGLTQSGVAGDNEGYNATTNSWSSLTGDPTSRVATCNGVIGAALYNAGGTGEAATAVTANDSFNLAKNKWTSKAPIPLAVAAAGSAVYKGQLYCFGGGSMNFTGFVGKVYKKLQIYHP